MKEEEVEDLLKDATKWITESQYKEIESSGRDMLALQQEMFSPGYNFFYATVLAKLSKEEMEETIVSINHIMKKFNGKNVCVVISALTYVLIETLRHISGDNIK